jgi:putative ABC transport system ATP-binding protein
MTASAATTAVYCTGVTKVFGTGSTQVTALRGIDLEVKTGELMMLVGPSGSGKTTLLSVIAGILDRNDGQCRVFDRDFDAMSPREKTSFRGTTIGFVFQQYNLIPTLTATENVAIPLLIRGVKNAEAIQRAASMLDQVGLAERSHAVPSELSGGEQQRVAIARALVHNPRLVVCDEPTSSIDHETGQMIMEMFRTVALDSNRALIIVTHDSRIFGFADRIAQMDDGHIIKVVNSVDDL